MAEREENPRLVERLLGWADRREVKEGRLITFGTLLLHEAAAALEAAENAAEDVAGEAVTEASVTPPGVDAEPVPPLHILCAVLRSDPGGDYYAVRCQAAAALEAAERERDEAVEGERIARNERLLWFERAEKAEKERDEAVADYEHLVDQTEPTRQAQDEALRRAARAEARLDTLTKALRELRHEVAANERTAKEQRTEMPDASEFWRGREGAMLDVGIWLAALESVGAGKEERYHASVGKAGE